MAIPNTFTNGTTANATEVNENFSYVETYPFAGDGSDGAQAITSGTTNLNLGQVYQYTTLSIDSGATLSTTDSDNYGLPMIIKVQGDCTIEGTLDLTGKGLLGGVGSGTAGTGHDDTNLWGSGGTAGGSAGGLGGAGGGASAINDGGNGSSTGGPTGTGGKLIPSLLRGRNRTFSGAGGGNSRDAGGTNADGGNGGGALILIVGGDLNFTGTINTSGADGEDLGTIEGGGGGGGTFLILYNTATSTAGTKTVAGGSGGTSSWKGGDGGDGTYQIIPLSEYFDDYRLDL